MRIILTGGGTGGSVTPLIAVAQEIKNQKPDTEFLFIGTKKGIPEKQLVKLQNLPFKGIFSGKLRRYFSFKNIIDPFFIVLGFIQCFFIIFKFKPDAIISAGSFVCVPVSWAGWFLKKPVFAHQQDIVPGLANKLIAPISRKITVSFSKSLNDFKKSKTVLSGNPLRSIILKGNKQKAIKEFDLKPYLPTVLIIGGGTGSKKINNMVVNTVPKLVNFCQIIHITGKQKSNKTYTNSNYHQYEFLKQTMQHAYAIADLVISRAGMGALTELSVLAKPVILIPIPDSHQEFNADYFANKNAVVLLNQKELTSEQLFKQIHLIVNSKEKCNELSFNISKLGNINASKKIAQVVFENI